MKEILKTLNNFLGRGVWICMDVNYIKASLPTPNQWLIIFIRQVDEDAKLN